jgi:hypothetical protein
MCQLELFDDSAGKLGVESEGQNAETAEQTAGTAEYGARTASARSFHPVPKAERGVLQWVEAQERHTPELSRAGGLSLLFPELLALVLQADSCIN